MPHFSNTSKARLATCALPLQTLFNEVIRYQDCTIVCGHRTQEEQERAFAEGKSKARWGQSKHNSHPSRAVDVMPYPIDWDDMDRLHRFAGYVFATADQLGIKVRWGGDFSGSWDKPHWELIDG